MKKIGLVTMHRVKNYGSILQTYAIQKVFEKLVLFVGTPMPKWQN